MGRWRRQMVRAHTLHTLIKDTLRALKDVADIIQLDSSLTASVQDLSLATTRCPALVILGTTPAARVRLLHALLGRRLLPDDMPRGCRWLRIQFGTTTQVHLTLGNSEFELVEDLECNKRPWDTLPLQDILRQENSDLATMLEIELNHPLLKNGMKIIIPPDISVDPGPISYKQLKKLHKDLYKKREAIIKNYAPIYLYAIDRISRTDAIFFDIINPMVNSRSDEDFWNTFNLHNMASLDAEVGGKSEGESEVLEKDGDMECVQETAVLTGENCLDLYQIKEISPTSQILFILLSDSEIHSSEARVRFPDTTESTEDSFRTEELPESDQGLFRGFLRPFLKKNENHNRTKRLDDQISFMNDLLDQWEIMSPPPSKHYVKSQYLIIDEVELLSASDLNIDPSKSVSLPSKDTLLLSDGIKDKNGRIKELSGDKTVKSRVVFVNDLMKFCLDCLHSYLLENCTRLSEVHVKIVQHLILASFSLARDLQVLPTKIQFVATQEQQLYEQIVQNFSEGDKKQELVRIMQEVLQEMKTDVENMDWSVDDLPCHQDRKYQISNSIFYSTRSTPQISYRLNRTTLSDPTNTLSYQTNNFSYPTNNLSDPSNTMSYPSNLSDPSNNLSDTTLMSDRNDNSSDAEEAELYESYKFDDYEIIHSNEESWSVSDFSRVMPNSSHIRVETESSRSTFCDSTRISMKEASLDVQKTVLSQLSRKISSKLVKFVNCLKDSYFGTLQRCLESLESHASTLGGARASRLCAQARAAAVTVDLTVVAAHSWLSTLIHYIYSLLHKLRLASEDNDRACCVLSPTWRRSLATQTVNSLSATRLARIISRQILERVSTVHVRYQAALADLESALSNRLHHSEDIKLAIRKKHAPLFARLCLESTSMCDLLMYGVPELGRVIGSGQYGVVYSVKGSWGGHSPAAVKCVLPADDRHCRELAMEFFYTRSIPSHPRVVRLLGSIWRATEGRVLLISERRERDLHTAVRRGLSYRRRMQVALDIVEGIRYLHSLGLVHRDIKMKNVLLDEHDRASLSDLGFCACEALMSGSIVGTPVHMAPDLLTKEYDASVDIYAFGILFWYLCAGSVVLPAAFETFQNKEQLWNKVKRGLRPERLPQFTDECWSIMTQCWASDPSSRAHLGDIQPILEDILKNAKDDVVIKTDEDSDDESL